MLEEDLELIRSYPRALPHVPFFLFRGKPMTRNALSKKWDRAVMKLKEKGKLDQGFNVSLYPGTRHSTISMLEASPEEIRRTSKHFTTKSFDRYLRWNDDRSRKVFEQVHNLQEPNQLPINYFDPPKKT